MTISGALISFCFFSTSPIIFSMESIGGRSSLGQERKWKRDISWTNVGLWKEQVRVVERGSFAPLIFATSGGMGKQATVFFFFYKCLASLLALKKDQPYSHVIGWIRCRLGFSLLRSSITCLRGTRSTAGFVPSSDALDLTICEG